MCVVQFIVCDHQEPGYLCPPVPHTLPVSPWQCSSFSLFNSCPILEVKHGVLGSSSPPRIGARPHAPPYPLLVEGYPRVQTSRPPGRGPWSSCVMPQPVHRKDATGRRRRSQHGVEGGQPLLPGSTRVREGVVVSPPA